MLFSGPVIAGFKAARAGEKAAHFAKMSARGEVVQQVATAYLHAIAAASEVDNAKALESTGQLLLSHVHAAHQAGTAANLDELRARVQYQTQQQARIADENSLEKDLILLKREIGIDPGQKIVLTDPAPYSELAAQTPEEVRAVAYLNRQDYQNLQNQAVAYKAIHTAYRSQAAAQPELRRLLRRQPGGRRRSHGNFVAQGTLSVPLFREGKLRGDAESAQAQLSGVEAQLADLRSTRSTSKLRSALLDVDATAKLVQVARFQRRSGYPRPQRRNRSRKRRRRRQPAPGGCASHFGRRPDQPGRKPLPVQPGQAGPGRATGVLEQQYRVYLGR